MIITRRSDLVIERANATLAGLVGHQVADLVGRPITVMRDDALSDSDSVHLEQSIQNISSSTHFDVTLRHADGQEILTGWHLQPVGERMFCTVTDLRERAAAERARVTRERALAIVRAAEIVAIARSEFESLAEDIEALTHFVKAAENAKGRQQFADAWEAWAVPILLEGITEAVEGVRESHLRFARIADELKRG